MFAAAIARKQTALQSQKEFFFGSA